MAIYTSLGMQPLWPDPEMVCYPLDSALYSLNLPQVPNSLPHPETFSRHVICSLHLCSQFTQCRTPSQDSPPGPSKRTISFGSAPSGFPEHPAHCPALQLWPWRLRTHSKRSNQPPKKDVMMPSQKRHEKMKIYVSTEMTVSVTMISDGERLR